MKTLGKLKINPEKRIGDDELMKLKGGYNWCFCWDCRHPEYDGYMIAGSCYNCYDLCVYLDNCNGTCST